jgi:gliding motility-associated-like protein
LSNDTDAQGNRQTVTPQLVIVPEGRLELNADGTYTFKPAPGFYGPVNFPYTVCDNGIPQACVQATLYIMVNNIKINVKDTAFCVGGMASLKASTSNVANPSFRWFADSTLQNLLYTGQVFTTNVNTTTKFYVAVFADGVNLTPPGYVKAVTVTIYAAAPKPSITAGGPLDICPGANVILSSSPASRYQWFMNGKAIPGATDQNYIASVEAIYTVSTNNSFGCSGPESDAVIVRYAPVPLPAIISANKLGFCEGDSAILISSPSDNYQWYKDGVLIPGINTQKLVVKSGGSYTVVLKNSYGCISAPANSVNITMYNLPARPVIEADGVLKICKDDIRVLSIKLSAGGSVQWFKNGKVISGATSETLSVSETGNFTAIITNSNGCLSEVSSPVNVEVVCVTSILLPDLFTPNGDGVNDVILPVLPGIKEFKCFYVYNRWGNLVFETRDSKKGWDGTYRGEHQPADTYIFYIEGRNSKGKVVAQRGMFTLIR